MRIFLIVLSGAFVVVSALPYLQDTARGKTKPRLASWFIWAAIQTVGAAASFTQHQIPAAIFTLVCSLECVAIVVLGFKRGDRHLELLDIICVVGASAGLVALILVRAPILALVIALITDFLGSIPTFKHSWLHPGEETWSTYLLEGIGSGITLFIANLHVFTAIGYPLYLFICNMGFTVIILVRSHRADSVSEARPKDFVQSAATSTLPAPTPSQPSLTTATAVSVVTAPAGPLKLTIASPTQVPALSWNPVSGATTYGIYRDGAKIATTQFSTYVDTTAPENIHVYYVTTTTVGGESKPSNEVSVMVDRIPPSMTYNVDSPPNTNGWHNQPVTVTFAAQDASAGVASISPPTTLANDGINQTVMGYAMNYAGDSSSIRAVISIDQTAPTLGPPAWSENPATTPAATTLSVPVVDHLSGVEQGEYIGITDPGPGNGTPMSLVNGRLISTFDTNVSPGQYHVYVRAKDTAGNWSELARTVLTVKS
jgi:hypothetical protein